MEFQRYMYINGISLCIFQLFESQIYIFIVPTFIVLFAFLRKIEVLCLFYLL